jgi:hypothetical protein
MLYSIGTRLVSPVDHISISFAFLHIEILLTPINQPINTSTPRNDRFRNPLLTLAFAIQAPVWDILKSCTDRDGKCTYENFGHLHRG